MERLEPKFRTRDNYAIAGGPTYYGGDGIRSYVPPASPAPAAISTPEPRVSSISKVLSTVVKAVMPSVLSSNVWSTHSSTMAPSNGSIPAGRNGNSMHTGGAGHILKMDAYLNISSDDDQEEDIDDQPSVSSNGPWNPIVRQMPRVNAAPTPRISRDQRVPMANSVSSRHRHSGSRQIPLAAVDRNAQVRAERYPSTVNAARPLAADFGRTALTSPLVLPGSAMECKPQKRARPLPMDKTDIDIFALKKPRLSFTPVDSSSKIGNQATPVSTVSRLSGRHTERNCGVRDLLIIPPSVSIPAKASSVAEAPALSRSSSRHSVRDNDQTVNIFSIPPRAGSSASVYGGSMPARISSRQSGSRPSSAIDSRPPVLTSSTRRLRERARVYNSETKRILKDLERASSRVQPSRNQSLRHSGRIAPEHSAPGSVERQGSVIHVPDDAQYITRLAMLGPSIMYRSFQSSDPSRWEQRRSRRAKHQVNASYPSSTVSSGPVFRFAKPYPVDMGKREDEKQKRHVEPSVFRFGNPQAASSVTAATTRMNRSADQSATGTQKGHVRFDLPPRHT